MMQVELQGDKVVVTLTHEEAGALAQEYDEITLELEANHEDDRCPTLDQLITSLPGT
jgi:hypothetical protein